MGGADIVQQEEKERISLDKKKIDEKRKRERKRKRRKKSQKWDYVVYMNWPKILWPFGHVMLSHISFHFFTYLYKI